MILFAIFAFSLVFIDISKAVEPLALTKLRREEIKLAPPDLQFNVAREGFALNDTSYEGPVMIIVKERPSREKKKKGRTQGMTLDTHVRIEFFKAKDKEFKAAMSASFVPKDRVYLGDIDLNRLYLRGRVVMTSELFFVSHQHDIDLVVIRPKKFDVQVIPLLGQSLRFSYGIEEAPSSGAGNVSKVIKGGSVNAFSLSTGPGLKLKFPKQPHRLVEISISGTIEPELVMVPYEGSVILTPSAAGWFNFDLRF